MHELERWTGGGCKPTAGVELPTENGQKPAYQKFK